MFVRCFCDSYCLKKTKILKKVIIQNFNDDIKVFYVKADSFPDGIKAAHNKLHSLVQSADGRRFFGISYPDKAGSIIYKAAAEESTPGEAEKYGCKTFVIKQGDYLSHTIKDWRKDESAIARTFQLMLRDPRVDSNGYCLEVYPNENDIVCLVKLDSNKVKIEK
jgi:hypothetical protein